MKILAGKDSHLFDLLLAMTEKEIKARYKNAFLGFLWIFLNPLLQMLLIGFIFQFIIPAPTDNYFLFLFTGLLPWNFFSYSVTKTTPSILFERQLIKKSKFPREAIVISIVLSNFFHFFISLLLLLILLIVDKIFFESYSFFDTLVYFLNLLLIVPISLHLLIAASGFSLLFSALNVKYRDINFIIQALMPLWFYATPILFNLSVLPKDLRLFFYLNPLTGIIECFQFILLKKPLYSDIGVLMSMFLVIPFFIWGWKIFNKMAVNFDDWL